MQDQYLFVAFLVVELCGQEPAQLLNALTYAILAYLLALSFLLAVPVVTMATDMALRTTVIVSLLLRTGSRDMTSLNSAFMMANLIRCISNALNNWEHKLELQFNM